MNRAVATCLGIGRLRPAPGSWASAVAVALAVAAYQAGLAWAVPLACVAAVVAGFVALPGYLAGQAGGDPPEVVIDEFAGQWLALSFTVIPLWWQGVADLAFAAWPGWVVPFLLFRLFDIWKPWVIGRADRMGGAGGLMLDDLLAGLFAGLGAVALAGLYHGAAAAWPG